MSRFQPSTIKATSGSAISIFLTNLHLLDLDRRDDWPSITPQTFTNKNTLQNEKARIRCVEWAFYRLFEIWDPEETKNKLQPFFPPLESLQSLNLRSALFRCINDMKKNGIIGKEVIVRKTFFDDCKGEKLLELLASFSALILRKVIAEKNAGKASIAGRLAIANTLTIRERKSLLPLAIAHRASLTAILRRKKDRKTSYSNFSRKLDAKECELDQRFEAILKTQDFLDKNPILDHTVARISSIFEKHWQGRPELAKVSSQGEEQTMKDPLLDIPFQQLWQNVAADKVDESIEKDRGGILNDLEKRVTDQQARLKQWRDLKDAIRRDDGPTRAPKPQSPIIIRSKTINPDLQAERDLVFSPRKSPRKSDWGVKDRDGEISPSLARSKANGSDFQNQEEFVAISPEFYTNSATKLMGQDGPGHLPQPMIEIPDDANAALTSEVLDSDGFVTFPSSDDVPNNGSNPSPCAPFDANDSGAHEKIPDLSKDTEAIATQVLIPPNGASEKLSADSVGGINLRYETCALLTPSKADSRSADDSDWISPVDKAPSAPGTKVSELEAAIQGPQPNEDDLLAEQIVSMAINATPTPAKPKLSLAERTRQSMAAIGPDKLHPMNSDELPSPLPAPQSSKQEAPAVNVNGHSTLLERTRQSISLLPSKPRGSRKSMADRRNSKMYPTNPFETPKKQLSQVQELTPPEELFSPGAGYDSVFKSRPKIGFSPTPSPAPEVS